jgi:hypothetical protein
MEHLGRAPRLLILLVSWALALPACTSYEYEEEVFLEVDGSGRLRVSGSSEILEVLHDLSEGGNTSSMTSRFEGPGFELDSIRETERDGRTFVHVQGRFADWNELCAHPAFAERECRLVVTDDELALTLTLPPPKGDVPEGAPPDATLALRFHFPSAVHYHNARSDIERGNIIGWERSVSEHFDADALVVEARFERRSVLATTAIILGTAVALVLFSVALALFLIVRKGRRELALENAHTSTVHRR